MFKALSGSSSDPVPSEPKKRVRFSKAALRNVGRHNKNPSTPQVRESDKLRSIFADQIIESEFDPEYMRELSQDRERDARREAYDLHRQLCPKDFGGYA